MFVEHNYLESKLTLVVLPRAGSVYALVHFLKSLNGALGVLQDLDFVHGGLDLLLQLRDLEQLASEANFH